MKILAPIGINRKKLKYRTSKALFLIIPIIVLVSLSVVATSQVKNIRKAMNDHIFKEIQGQGTVLEIEYPRQQFQFGTGGPSQSSSSQSQYTEVDLAKIKAITNVKDATINYSLPISNAKTTDLFVDKTVNFRNISALNENMANLYTQDPFSYTDGQTIPIILNANQFVYNYEDWGGKTTFSLDFQNIRQNAQNRQNGQGTQTPEDLMSSSPIKSSAISYDKNALIGKEFTITFGGFSDIQDYSISRSSGTTTMTKLTTSQLNTAISDRKNAVNKYWKYDSLAKGVTYKFKVVGIIDSTNNDSIYIPDAFAKKVMSDYINLQLKSRLTSDIPTSVLNSTYLGMTYNGSELLSSQGARMFGGGFRVFRNIGPRGVEVTDSNANGQSLYEIPGLVIAVDQNDASNVTGIYSDATVFEKAVQTGDRIDIKINDFLNRAQVVKDLNSNGYAFQDKNDYGVFNKVQNTLNVVSTGVIIGFIGLTIAVIIFTMSKFVSESRKEIGIFRAVGFTKGNILWIFMVQSVMYVVVGYIIGLALGFGMNLLASKFVAKWFDGFVNNTVRETFNVVGNVNNSVFNKFDLMSALILTGILLALTLIISFIPAFRASNVSPVEAIKSE